MEVKMTVPHVLSAFAPETIGTKVIDPDRFLAILGGAIRGHDLSRDRVPGQHFIVLSEEAVNTVSCGVGRRTANPDDYVVRAHRGRVDAYLRRDLAAPAESLAVVVYTHDAYNADPQVAAEGRQVGDDVTHVIVAVRASAGPRPPLSPYRFVSNLAGGNREATLWSADEIRAMAQEIVEYDQGWCVVAD